MGAVYLRVIAGNGAGGVAKNLKPSSRGVDRDISAPIILQEPGGVGDLGRVGDALFALKQMPPNNARLRVEEEGLGIRIAQDEQARHFQQNSETVLSSDFARESVQALREWAAGRRHQRHVD